MRYALSLIIGAAIAFALFVIMETLVTGMRWKPEDNGPSVPIEFVRLQREETVQQKQRAIPERPPEPEAPPPPRAQVNDMIQPPGAAISVSVPQIDTSFNGIGVGDVFNAQTTALIPLAQVQPQYPRQAQIDGIEGWVALEFTITEFGTVENVRVLDSSPRGVFDANAIRAISRWKFKPKVENGVPVALPRATYRLEFNLAKEEGAQ